jgi:hypothetical protein
LLDRATGKFRRTAVIRASKSQSSIRTGASIQLGYGLA